MVTSTSSWRTTAWVGRTWAPGAGTRVTATIPLEQPADAAPSAPALPVVSAERAEEIQRDRIHHLGLRALSCCIVAGVLVAVWALTGPDLPWIVWPLLGLGLVAGLDAWRVLSLPPVRDTELTGDGDRAAEVRRLLKRRRLRHSAGSLAILNVFLIGVWIASGSSYFWPAWVILGSALAIALKAMPRPARANLLEELS